MSLPLPGCSGTVFTCGTGASVPSTSGSWSSPPPSFSRTGTKPTLTPLTTAPHSSTTNILHEEVVQARAVAALILMNDFKH